MFRHRFWVYVIFVALFAFSLGKSESAEAASGTVYESEPNNTYLQADSTRMITIALGQYLRHQMLTGGR